MNRAQREGKAQLRSDRCFLACVFRTAQSAALPGLKSGASTLKPESGLTRNRAKAEERSLGCARDDPPNKTAGGQRHTLEG